VTATPLHDCETWSPHALAEHRLTALRAQLRRLAARDDGLGARWRELGWEPGDLRDLDDLAALPVTTKADFLAAVQRRPPYGDLLAVDAAQVARVHFSSGTTAAPTPMAWTADDLERWAQLYARAAHSQGVRAGAVYQCLFSYAWFVGGLGATAGYQRLGATVIPGGSGDTERQIETILRFGTTDVGGTPSFLLHLAEAAHARGTPLHDGPVRRVMVGGEPGGALDGTRAAIEAAWGARCFDGYGCLEFQPIAWECEAQAGGHLPEDFVHAEVVDAQTHRPVPDGTPGVLVLTHVDKQACPLVRWWTGDVVVLDRTRCACGRTHARLPGGVRGRADDMLVIRGVNVFPSAIEDVVRRQPGAAGEYRIVLDPAHVDDRTGYRTGLRLVVEAEPGAEATLSERVAAAMHRELKVRASVEIVDRGRLERSTHKTARVVPVQERSSDGG
jgi:phenylacetate-CoA ligase